MAGWTFKAQRGFFSHDEDTESGDTQATTQPQLGLIKREYPTDAEYDPNREKTQWERFKFYLTQLNQEDPEHKIYKLLFVIRHGQGVHNVKEEEIGREEWKRDWSKLSGDGTSIWEDAALTPFGEQQARELSTIFGNPDVPYPDRIYSSPLLRCLRTTELVYGTHLSRIPPVIKENLRERLGVETCDKRRSKTYIASKHGDFRFESGFTEEDQLWKPDVRESAEEHTGRSKVLLQEIFCETEGDIIVSLTAHSGTSRAIFRATGWNVVWMATGTMYPLLVLGEKRDGVFQA